MLKTKIAPPNAILFIFDPTNKDVLVPSYIDGNLTSSTETCISVGTQSYVDGETEVFLGLGEILPLNLVKIFSGQVQTLSGKIAVMTSQFQSVLELDVSRGNVQVTIGVDDVRNPGQVGVCVDLITK